jgi:uncharacterized protein
MDELNKIKKLLVPIFKETQTQRAIVFGSFAKNTQTKKSDLDLIIITETDKRFLERFDQFEKVHFLISDRSVDMLIYTPDELNKISHRRFIKQILEEGKIIYES